MLFVACIRRHSQDRDLTTESPYWICAYANNQWDLNDALTDDPDTTSFRRALGKVEGTVAILDQGGIVFKRLWCGYEAYVSLVSTVSSDFKYDIYTAVEGGGIGITDGFAATDGWYVKIKHQREAAFPLNLGAAALNVEVQKAESSVVEDRIHILNKIVGSTDLNAIVPEEHQEYEKLNGALHAQFAASLFRAALDAGDHDLKMRFLSKLPSGQMRSLMLNFWQCANFTKEAAADLINCLPTTLLSLDLNFKEASARSIDVADALFKWIEGQGSGLMSLNLHDNAMNPDSLQILVPVLHRLSRLGLGFNGLGAEGALLLKDVLLHPDCQVTALNLNKNSIGGYRVKDTLHSTPDGANALAMALSGNHTLTSLSLRWNELAVHMETIAAALLTNTTLEKLDLNWNGLSDGETDGAVQVNALLDVLRKHETLNWVSLEGNQISSTLKDFKQLMQDKSDFIVVLSDEEMSFDSALPRLVLVEADSPQRCIFQHAAMLPSGRGMPLELSSHPGCGVVEVQSEPVLKGGEWQVLYMGVGRAEHSVKLTLQNQTLLNSDGWLLFPQGGQIVEGVKFELVKNKFDAALLGELFNECLTFEINADGTISPCANKSFVLGADMSRQTTVE